MNRQTGGDGGEKIRRARATTARRSPAASRAGSCSLRRPAAPRRPSRPDQRDRAQPPAVRKTHVPALADFSACGAECGVRVGRRSRAARRASRRRGSLATPSRCAPSAAVLPPGRLSRTLLLNLFFIFQQHHP